MSKTNKERLRLKRAIIIAYPTVLIALLILIIVYSKFKFNIGAVCPLNEIFGWECPGCGGTRMAVAMLYGDFKQAFRYNTFIFLTLPILIIVYVWQTVKFIIKNETSEWLASFLVTYAILLIIYGIIRNIEVFSWLKPVDLDTYPLYNPY